MPKPWTANEWLFWQFTDRGDGKLYGVESSRIDLNYFNGDLAAFQQRFKLSTTPPPPPGPVWYKVTATALNVRKGTGTTFDVLGLLKKDDVVQGLASFLRRGLGADQTTLRRPDGLGVASIPHDHIGANYTASSSAASTSSADGRVVQGEHLRAECARRTRHEFQGDRSCSIKMKSCNGWRSRRTATGIRSSGTIDGFTGWCSKQFLVETTAPPPPQEETTTWYQVTATTLNVREGPAATFKSSGILSKGEGVAGVDVSPDGTWRKDPARRWASAAGVRASI